MLHEGIIDRFEQMMDRTSTSRIKWLDWTDEAFQQAKKENKPVLLDISAVWCHWCHRLDQDTYSVPDIAEYIEANLIPIRVDTDKRPDINRRYNMGGWPTTAFLTPDGRVIGGGTYFPPEQMRQVLRDVKSFWEKSQGKPTPELELPEPENIPIGQLSSSIINEILGEVANNFDPVYGGFGTQPKFPNTEAHELALMKYHYSGNREFLRIVSVTLQNVGRSGMYDKEMGGFFRYSTLRDWSVPHFEKMCEDNAKWLQLYLHAYQATGESFYADIARGIIDYVNTWLSDQKNGCFYGSQDADEEYYKLNKAGRTKAKPPYIDENIYTNWNAMMICAFLEASFALGDMHTREYALKSLDRLLALNYKPGEGMYHFYDGQPKLQNQLADQVQTAKTLCNAYECTGDRESLELAEELMETAARKLFDSEHGGFFDMMVDPNAPGFLSKPAKPLEENSLAVRVLTKLFHLTGKEKYRKQAEKTLTRFVEIYPQFGFMAAEYALAADAFLNEPTTVRIVGSPEKTQTKGLMAEAYRIYEPRKVIQILDPKKDSETIGSLGFPETEQPTAYICLGRACTAPIIEPRQVGPELSRMVAAQIKN
jgi:uncharacterized protein YyaL (SSP411 family)